MSAHRIGKYRVIGKLGEGGMARVLLTVVAGPHGFNKLLVVKELREELAQDPEFLSMFLDEARLAARLNHPNVVQTYEVGQDGDQHFIAMEYLEGQPLQALLRRVGRRAMPLSIHVRILADVLAGLEYAHTLADFDGSPLEVVHRDVSPQNVFVTCGGQVKLVDFGIAKAAGAVTHTRDGVFKGKLSYVAPEQANGLPVDHRADLFAVGVMLWEAIAGRRIAQGDDEASMFARRIAGRDPRLGDVVEDAPGELVKVCEHAMALDPADRFESARAFQDALEECLTCSLDRVGSKEVGALVRTAFQEEREQIRVEIDRQIRRLRELPESGLTIVDIGSGPPTSRAPPTTSRTMVLSSATRRRRRLRWVAGGALLLCAAGAAVALSREVTPARPPGQAIPAPSVTVSAQQAPAPLASITFLLRYPAGARAKLDGSLVTGNPFVAKVARDGGLHRVTVEQEGYLTEERAVTFDKDIELAVELTAAPARPAARPGVAKGSPPPPAATAPTTAAAPAAPTAAQPDDEDPKQRSRRRKFDIDEQNPYKK